MALNKDTELELTRRFFDGVMDSIESNVDDVIYETVDPECEYEDEGLCDRLNFDTVKEVIALGFKAKYGAEWKPEEAKS